MSLLSFQDHIKVPCGTALGGIKSCNHSKNPQVLIFVLHRKFRNKVPAGGMSIHSISGQILGEDDDQIKQGQVIIPRTHFKETVEFILHKGSTYDEAFKITWKDPYGSKCFSEVSCVLNGSRFHNSRVSEGVHLRTRNYWVPQIPSQASVEPSGAHTLTWPSGAPSILSIIHFAALSNLHEAQRLHGYLWC